MYDGNNVSNNTTLYLIMKKHYDSYVGGLMLRINIKGDKRPPCISKTLGVTISNLLPLNHLG